MPRSCLRSASLPSKVNLQRPRPLRIAYFGRGGSSPRLAVSGADGAGGSGSGMGRARTSARSVRYRRPWRVNSRLNSNCTGDITGFHNVFRFGLGFDLPCVCCGQPFLPDLRLGTARPCFLSCWLALERACPREAGRNLLGLETVSLNCHGVVGSITDARKGNG